MRISDVIGLLGALIGSTATLVAAWAYIRSKNPPKGELLRAAFAITVILASILALAVIVSRATTIKINGQDTLPVPPLSVPVFPAPGGTTPTRAPTPTLAPIPSPSPTLAPSPSPSPSPSSTLAPSPSSSPTLAPSPTPKRKKG